MQIAVLGAGSWGTALAWLLGSNRCAVRLWCRDPEHAAALAEERVNRRYLPDLPLPASVAPTGDLDRALTGASLLVVAVPAQAVRGLLRRCAVRRRPGVLWLIAAKGLEQDSGLRMSQVALQELGEMHARALAVLSGPNLAAEIVRKIPTGTVIASLEPEPALLLQPLLATPFFRVYTNSDLIGVELGGALKNPIAVAAGIADGLGMGSNTRATLLTRGLAEMTRLGVAAGASAGTFSGLSGLGDLVATATSPLSRNYRLGLALGRGSTLDEAREQLHQVAEGVPTTAAACRLAERLGVEVPIMQELRRVLFEGKPVAAAVEALLSRPYRDEAGLP